MTSIHLLGGGRITQHGRDASPADRNLEIVHVGNPDLMSSNCRVRGQLTQDIVSALEQHCPSSPVSSGQTGNAEEARQAFVANFPHGSVWENFIQLNQAANFLGDMHGFTTRPSGMPLVCGCGQNHKDKRKKTQLSLLDPGEEVVIQRRTDPLSHINCGWVLRCRPQTKRKKGDGGSVLTRKVVVTTTHFLHNHSLDPGLMMKAKKSAEKYTALSSDVVAHMFKMISSGPIPTLTL